MKRLPIMITGVCLPLGKKRPKKYLSAKDAREGQKRILSRRGRQPETAAGSQSR